MRTKKVKVMKAKEIQDIIINGFKKRLKGKIEGTFGIEESTDEPYTMVGIELEVYNYFVIRFNYDKGAFGCTIINGKYGIDLESTEKWFDEADLDKFFSDIIEDIEIRIPDKFLRKKGWKRRIKTNCLLKDYFKWF